MKRETLVLAVIVVVVALVMGVGVYLVATWLRPTTPVGGPPSVTFAPHWNASLQEGLTYSEPVLGPTTPLNDAVGGLWVINAAREGVIFMNLSRLALGYQPNPFVAGNDSLRLDLSADFAESLRPLGRVYYIVPARDAAVNGTTGPSLRNGALAFFTGADFVAADPFNKSVFFRYTLPFVPIWTGEDPASAGNLLAAPKQLVLSIGLFQISVGAYRYFWASDGNHTVVFELNYVHAGYCPCEAPSGRVVLQANVSLSAPPFVYYNQDFVNSTTNFRSGAGAAIVLPLTNHTLEILDTQPVVRAWVPLTLTGQPAVIAGDIGYVQTTFPLRLLLPVRSASSAGLVAFDLGGPSKAYEYVSGNADWIPVGLPQSRGGQAVYEAWYDPSAKVTRFAGVNGTGVPIPQFAASVPGRAQSVFQAYETGKVFAETEDGGVVSLNTTFTSPANVTPVAFPLAVPSPGTVVVYAGAAGGTRFGTVLSSLEILGAWTDSNHATTALSQLLFPPGYATASGPGRVSPGFSLPLPMVFAGVAAVAVRPGRRTSCSARASGPRSSCRRTRA